MTSCFYTKPKRNREQEFSHVLTKTVTREEKCLKLIKSCVQTFINVPLLSTKKCNCFNAFSKIAVYTEKNHFYKI